MTPSDSAAHAGNQLGHHMLWLVAAVAAAMLLAAPSLVRAGRRRRRLGRIRDDSRPAAAAWEEVEDTATDLGLGDVAVPAKRDDGDVMAERAGLASLWRRPHRRLVTMRAHTDCWLACA
ncbi:hypothetical protein [Actinomyces ruminis]|uniref:hypothetical protein n=1 Tax=Actinomyces ruminis TaxID=1937003 RepID=UPI001177B525|nr:hypothetical protein [Actinomyces ruminis]